MKVTDYVAKKIHASRIENPDKFQNISVIRTNAMQLLCNYIPENSIKKMFFCFPDPNFKKKHFKRRIISEAYLQVYKKLLVEGGKIYACTDVEQLH